MPVILMAFLSAQLAVAIQNKIQALEPKHGAKNQVGESFIP
jgi:hypothetical protein